MKEILIKVGELRLHSKENYCKLNVFCIVQDLNFFILKYFEAYVIDIYCEYKLH